MKHIIDFSFGPFPLDIKTMKAKIILIKNSLPIQVLLWEQLKAFKDIQMAILWSTRR